MSNKKPESKNAASSAGLSSGRISGLKVSKDSCEFKLKGGKGSSKQFLVNGQNGLQFDIAAKVLVAAWEGKHKITVHPMTVAGMENIVASIRLGSLREEPKPAKVDKPAKAAKPEKGEKTAKAAKAEKAAVAEPLTV
jgi:hypothetical protein